MKNLAILFCLICTIFSVNAQESPLVMSPALSPDGKTIAFSYQGDIWTVPSTGGKAYRLTIHEGYDGRPVFSPDGQSIAFASDRFGNRDVFVIPAAGGRPKQLTHHSTFDVPVSWKDNKTILFLTSRIYGQVEREVELYQVSTSGSTPTRALDALALDGQYSANGSVLALVRGTCRTSRETYYGPANRDIWLYYPAEDKYKAITDFDGNEFSPKWAGNQTLYYLSPKSGKYNIYQAKLSANQKQIADEKKMTDLKSFGIFSFDVSADGTTLVYHTANEIYIQKTNGGNAQKVNIEIATDYRFDPEVKRSFSTLEEYSISPNGERVAFAVHGEIFVTSTDKEDTRTVQLTNSAARDREPTWLNDSTLLFVSDQAGQYDIFAISSADTNEVDLLQTMKHATKRLTSNIADERYLSLSPDGKKLLFRRDRGELWIAEIDSIVSLQNVRALHQGWASPSGISWSPDSRWIAYSMDDLNFNEEVYIHDVADSIGAVNVSMHPRNDNNPVWSADGSKLAFSSERNNGDSDVWFVWLKEEDYYKSSTEWKENELAEKKDKKKKDTKVDSIQIDFKDIYHRVRQVTKMPGDERGIVFDPDSETLYYISRSNTGKNSSSDVALFSVKWNGKENKQVMSGSGWIYGLSLSKDDKYLFAVSSGKLKRIKLQNKKAEGIATNARMTINYPEELEQIFNEAWRALEKGFYDPQFHGQDWKKLREKYEPLCMMASTKEDFQFMFNAMLGQLDASHMGLRGGNNPKSTQRNSTGQIGVELAPEDEGVRVLRVLAGSPASREESRLYPGDLIQKVNGKAVNIRTNFFDLMDETAGKRVLLAVMDSTGEDREVIIWPVRSLRSALYEDWVAERKRLTEEYSNGRLGYIHIQGMNWTSFERFERELMASGYGKDGIIIDVRYNGGGWTTDYLMAVLTVRQHAYTVPRGAAKNLKKEHEKFRDYYPYGERLPLSSWTKPSIAICNENSYSNAEIFSHAYKSLDLGTLVGQPTFGAVISTGAYGLMDGSAVRMPFRAWYVKESDMNMEHGPAVPDVEIELSPDYKAKGKDEQLQEAAKRLLKQLEMKR